MRGLTKFKNIPIMIGANTLYMLLFAVGWFLIFNGLIATISFSILVLLILLSIVAHELGHAFCARAFGYDTKRIVITPLGGYAQIDVEDFDPLQADLEYSIQSGSLPPGTNININSGEIT